MVIIFSFGGELLHAQQLPRFSQYYANEFLINPAVAGYDGRTVINLGARKQWVGFSQNTPASYIISLQGRLLKTGYSLKTGSHGNKIFIKQAKDGLDWVELFIGMKTEPLKEQELNSVMHIIFLSGILSFPSD